MKRLRISRYLACRSYKRSLKGGPIERHRAHNREQVGHRCCGYRSAARSLAWFHRKRRTYPARRRLLPCGVLASEVLPIVLLRERRVAYHAEQAADGRCELIR